MKLTANDIRNQKFRTKLKGLDKDDVMTYLQLVADDYETLQKEAARHKNQLKKKDTTINAYKNREEKMKSLFESLCKEKGVSLHELNNHDSIN